jgi:anti-anti-sigma factor
MCHPRPAESAAPGDRPPVFASALPARAPHLAAAVAGVAVAVNQPSDEIIVRVKGESTAKSAGALLSDLLIPAAHRRAIVILDLSELRSISSLAMGVLVAYRRGVVRRGGRVRLAERLQPAVKEALERAGLLALFGSPDRGQGCG